MQLVDWDHLRFVIEVGRHGSATAAARQLRVDKATVGRRLQAAERALGVRLFERRADGFVPTESGRIVIDAARSITATLDGLDALLRNATPRSTIRLTAPPWFIARIVMPELTELRRLHPYIDLVCNPSSRATNPARRDAEIMLQTAAPDSRRLHARSAGKLAFALYASHGYVRAYGAPADRHEVMRRPLLGYETSLANVAEYEWLDASSPGKRVVLRVLDTRTLAEGVRVGLGIGVLPCFIGDDLPGLVRLACAPVAIEKVWIVAPGEQRAVPGVREVVDVVIEAMRRHALALQGEAS
jgi:DNA-binding transcriptional LysR family regulator